MQIHVSPMFKLFPLPLSQMFRPFRSRKSSLFSTVTKYCTRTCTLNTKDHHWLEQTSGSEASNRVHLLPLFLARSKSVINRKQQGGYQQLAMCVSHIKQPSSSVSLSWYPPAYGRSHSNPFLLDIPACTHRGLSV